jgi:diaminohydroxyphosphoribosylaminopyrimidine deaminase/5-amino-6-(5-phosphoribosylamino)uracil reductase
MTECDGTWMGRALELAERGRGGVEPNPLVGAVVVQDNRPVGEGWHERYGEAHAEVRALAAAGERARGATLFVTLEPCCHQGKTPPCTRAILAAGVGRVVAAMHDPFPQVAGHGLAQLKEAGLEVEVGLGEVEARRLNAPYLKLLTTGRPYVHAKWAMTLDGKIASRTGDSRWISGEAARRWVHDLRGRMDAIVIGGGTAVADDPLLTARPPGPRTPVRVVLSSKGALPLSSQLVHTARQAPVLIVTTGQPDERHADELREHGCEVLPLSGADQVARLLALLDELGRRRLTNILVEGGATMLGSFRDAGAIDEVHVFLAPRLLGGAGAVTPMAGRGADRIADALVLAEWQLEPIEGDFVIHGRVAH